MKIKLIFCILMALLLLQDAQALAYTETDHLTSARQFGIRNSEFGIGLLVQPTLYSRAKILAEYSARIFVVRQRGRAAGMLAAFQGSAALSDGKKTGEELPIFPLVSMTYAKAAGVPEEQEAFEGDRNIYVGDIITLEIGSEDFSAEELMEKFKEFEVLELTEESGGYRLSLRTFDPGKYVVLLGNKEIVINVGSTIDDIDRDDIFEGGTQVIKPGFSFQWRILFYISAGVFILSGGFILLKIVLKKKTKKLNPYELFLQRSGTLAVEGDDYFVDLTRFFKEYIGSLYQCWIIGKTSAEIIFELKEIQPLESMLSNIEEWLVECDRMKFSGIDVTIDNKQEHYGKLLELALEIRNSEFGIPN